MNSSLKNGEFAKWDKVFAMVTMSSVDDKVMYLLNLPVTLEPDAAIGRRGFIKRKVLVKYYGDSKDHDPGGMRIGIDITVSPEEPRLHKSTFTSSYPRSGLGIKQCRELQNFLYSNIGEEVYMTYRLIRKYGTLLPSVQMISPVQTSQTLFVREDHKSYCGLVPYMLKR